MTAIVVPYYPSSPSRERAFGFVRARLAELHPDWPPVVASDGLVVGERHKPTLWSKALATNRTISTLDTRETLVVIDADVLIDPDALRAAVHAVDDGAPWAVPHGTVYRLDPDFTETVLAGPLERTLGPLTRCYRKPYLGVPGGGCLVVSRAAWELVGGFDPRFVGWGSEDVCLGYALDTLAGQHHRGDAPLWHLYHPSEDHTERLDDSQRLEAAYLAANGSEDAMRALVDNQPG